MKLQGQPYGCGEACVRWAGEWEIFLRLFWLSRYNRRRLRDANQPFEDL